MCVGLFVVDSEGYVAAEVLPASPDASLMLHPAAIRPRSAVRAMQEISRMFARLRTLCHDRRRPGAGHLRCRHCGRNGVDSDGRRRNPSGAEAAGVGVADGLRHRRGDFGGVGTNTTYTFVFRAGDGLNEASMRGAADSDHLSVEGCRGGHEADHAGLISRNRFIFAESPNDRGQPGWAGSERSPLMGCGFRSDRPSSAGPASSQGPQRPVYSDTDGDAGPLRVLQGQFPFRPTDRPSSRSCHGAVCRGLLRALWSSVVDARELDFRGSTRSTVAEVWTRSAAEHSLDPVGVLDLHRGVRASGDHDRAGGVHSGTSARRRRLRIHDRPSNRGSCYQRPAGHGRDRQRPRAGSGVPAGSRARSSRSSSR